MKIIDVSYHNGKINWNKVKADGIKGVIIRAGYGTSITQKDKLFEENYNGAKAAGLHIGTYWYLYATNVNDAKTEAEVFLKVIKGKQFDLPIYLDIEDKAQIALSKTVCTDMANAFNGKLEAKNYFADVYSFDSFFSSNLEQSIQKRYATWVSRVENIKPKFVDKWGMHQYSWKGSINGINGDVDLNNCVKNYPTLIREKGFNK